MSLIPSLHALAGFFLGGATFACLMLPAYWRLKRRAAQAIWKASHDDLTGLANYTLVRQRGETMLKRATTPIVCVFADLNNFKQVNDEFGHDAGDQVLVHAAQYFSDAFAAHGIIGRRSGDEFTAILIVPQGENPQEWINQLITTLTPKLDRLHNIRTSSTQHNVSIGTATALPGQTPNLALLLRKADIAMYHAKRTGQAIVHWHPNQPPPQDIEKRPTHRLRDDHTEQRLSFSFEPRHLWG